MVRPLSFEAVRKHQGEARAVKPPVLAAYNELVDDDLSYIGKIAELGLPNDEAVARIHRVAVFETEN